MNNELDGCGGNREVAVFVDVFCFTSSHVLFSANINISASFISSTDNSYNVNGSR